MLPLFMSHFSIGRSILTLEKPDSIKTNSPVSILSIAKTHELKDIYLAENSFSGFVEAYNNCKSNHLNLKFGIKFTICNDMNDKSDASFKSESKIIVWMKNSNGYKDLVKLYSKTATDGFYYIPRLDWNTLVNMHTENLLVSIPPYDSFLHINLIENGNCVPNMGKIKPNILLSNMELPFDNLIKEAHLNYAKQNNLEVIECNPTYYYRETDFKPYMVYRAINNRKTFSNPGLDYFCSNQFSFETYLKKIGKTL